MDDVGAALAVLDGDGVVIVASPAATRLFERLRLPIVTDAPIPAEMRRELARTPLGEAITWRPEDGESILGYTPYGLGENHTLLLFREITEQQRALTRRLHQQRLESTGRLVAHIAHDLRAPLSSIVYNTDLLGRRELPAGTLELLHDTQVAAEQLRRTIAGLLDFVRLGPPVTSTMSLRELIDRVSSLLRSVFRAGQHELEIALHDDQVCVCGNPIAIEQILVNLLLNATEASSGAPVRIRVTSEPVPPGGPWRAVDDVVRIRVADDGPGIAPDRRHIVFEPFVTSKPDGTGIGLAVSREAAAALGGHLAIEDSPVGACFALVLPIAHAEAAA